MPVRIIGMIGVDPPKGNTLHVISGGISPGFLAEFARAHEDAGFDLVLVGSTTRARLRALAWRPMPQPIPADWGF